MKSPAHPYVTAKLFECESGNEILLLSSISQLTETSLKNLCHVFIVLGLLNIVMISATRPLPKSSNLGRIFIALNFIFHCSFNLEPGRGIYIHLNWTQVFRFTGPGNRYFLPSQLFNRRGVQGVQHALTCPGRQAGRGRE